MKLPYIWHEAAMRYVNVPGVLGIKP